MSEFSAHHEEFQDVMEQIMIKLKQNPSAITVEDARRLSENIEARDEKSARIISAVEAFAIANEDLHEEKPSLDQEPHTSLLTVVNDLNAAVDANPRDVNTEVLQTTQSIVSKMQKAIGRVNAPHPELENKLQEEIAKLEPKIAQGIVTKAEADHLHTLEARAHGYTEKGGITAIAQSVVAKRERQMSLSNGSTSSSGSGRSRANSKSFTALPQEQSHHDKESNLHKIETATKSKIERSTATEENVNRLHSREARAHGYTEKGGLAATGQSAISKKRNESLSDRSNVSRASEVDYERRTDQSQQDKELSLKTAQLSIDVDEEKLDDKGGHLRENSQSVVEASG